MQNSSQDMDIASQIQAVLDSAYAKDGPGAAVRVDKDGVTLFRGAAGMANLELDVPIRPEMVFRLGSITKQFTAVAILMLAQRGKLSLQDEITRFLPDYPTQGQCITVEHLLTHTSGVKNYTALAAWVPLWRKDMSLEELIGLTKDEPLDFKPGESWNYSNSGYVLLGAIIEKASGQTYEQFIQENIFTPLGMKNSYYDHTEWIIPGRASGYQKGPDGYQNAPYLSMTQPHAAGSLASTVDDMVAWDAALYTDRLVCQDLLQKAWTPYRLANGESTHYGYGWSLGEFQGQRMIAHGGGIHGFLTHGIRLPEARVYVSVLTNTSTPDVMPDKVALQIAGLVIGKPFNDPEPMRVDPKILETYVGKYQLEETTFLAISLQDEKLIASMPGGQREALAVNESEFFFKADLNRLVFKKDAEGKVEGLELKGFGHPGIAAHKVE